MLCMLCEAVRSVGSTVYTWERPNNHSTGTWHIIGEPACWEKTQLYTCISGRREMLTFWTDRARNHHDLDGRTSMTTLPTRGTMCRSDADSHNSDWLACSVSISSLFEYKHGAHQGKVRLRRWQPVSGQCSPFGMVCVHWCEINSCRPLTEASNQLADIRKYHKCFFTSVAHSGLTSTSTASRLRVTDPPRRK